SHSGPNVDYLMSATATSARAARLPEMPPSSATPLSKMRHIPLPGGSDISGCLNAAFGNARGIFWDQLGQPDCCLQIYFEGPQITVVHADQVATGVHSTPQLFNIVYLTQHVQAVCSGFRHQLG